MNLKQFDIVLKEIRLRVICSNECFDYISKLMIGHSYIESIKETATYTLIIEGKISPKNYNLYVKMYDKWFDNASCDIWIDDKSKIVYMDNIDASPINKENLIKYSTCNLFNRLLEEKGYIAFHSSCVEKDNKGIAFIAPRNFGKTSCMLTLMNEGYNSVSNDKLGITIENNKILGYGVAQNVSIRLSNGFLSLPQNKKYLNFFNNQNINQLNKIENNNIHLETSQIAKLNNVKQIPETQLNTFIFPNYNKIVKNIKIYKMKNIEKENLLLTQYLPLVHETNSFFKYATIEKNEKYTKEEIINKLLSKDFYKIIQGENSNKSLIKVLNKINGTY